MSKFYYLIAYALTFISFCSRNACFTFAWAPSHLTTSSNHHHLTGLHRFQNQPYSISSSNQPRIKNPSSSVFRPLQLMPESKTIIPVDEIPKNSKDNIKREVGFGLHEFLIYICAYLCVGVFAYSFLLKERWSIIDSLYFCVTTFTTVGYGDLTPTTHAGKIFTCGFGLGGIAFLGAALYSLGAKLVQAELDAVKVSETGRRKQILDFFTDRMPKIVKNRILNDNQEEEADEPIQSAQQQWWQPSPFSWKKQIKKIVKKCIPFLGLLFMGGFVMGRLEGWSLVDSMYYAVSTAGTVGYGDIVPTKPRSKLAACFFLPLCVGAAGDVLGTVASLVWEYRQQKAYSRLVKQRQLSMECLDRMDVDQDGKVYKEDFVNFMLVEMQFITQEQLNQLHEQFNRLDVTGEGYLDQEDLKLMAKWKKRAKEKKEKQKQKEEKIQSHGKDDQLEGSEAKKLQKHDDKERIDQGVIGQKVKKSQKEIQHIKDKAIPSQRSVDLKSAESTNKFLSTMGKLPLRKRYNIESNGATQTTMKKHESHSRTRIGNGQANSDNSNAQIHLSPKNKQEIFNVNGRTIIKKKNGTSDHSTKSNNSDIQRNGKGLKVEPNGHRLMPGKLHALENGNKTQPNGRIQLKIGVSPPKRKEAMQIAKRELIPPAAL